MDINRIIHTLKTTARYYNPTQGDTLVISDQVAQEIIVELTKVLESTATKATMTLKKSDLVHGAKPK
jgi:hypothetical protein